MEICFYGMASLFNNAPVKEMFNENVLKDAKDTTFKIDEITLVKMIDNYNCDVIAKDDKGYRSYRIGLEKNGNFEHLYRILDVKGQRLVSEYQWRSL